MQRFSLYLKYAWRSIERGGQRTFFAILCVAVGVAAIVALQTTGLTISETVSGDAKAEAGADVLVTNRQSFFTKDDLAKLDTLKKNDTITDYTVRSENLGVTVLKPDGRKSNDFASFYSVFPIDPAKFPYYGKTDLNSPTGQSMRDVLKSQGQIVLNPRMAGNIEAKVGDKIKITGESPIEVTVVGILTSKATPPSDQAEFLGYGYISYDTAGLIFSQQLLLPDKIFVKTPGTTLSDEKARDAIKALSPNYDAVTSTERNEAAKRASDGMRDLLIYVGLVSLLIGSVGVVNTMLVVVGRRSTEIATIKALGMESGQTVRIFVLEAAILGLLGSILGVILGEILAVITSQAAEGFVNQSLEYRFYWSPVFMGLAVGIVTAIVFGLLPAYSASKIPPAQVLRQKVNALPRISILAMLMIIALMTVVMGLMAGFILNGQLLLGIIVAFATLVICTILVLIYSGILWLVGKLPMPLGLNYKMARRNLSRARTKNATTVLVMTVGVFAMALVLILSGSLKETIRDTLEKNFGYNIQVQTRTDQQQQELEKAFDSKTIPGLEKYLSAPVARVRWTGANGVSAEELVQKALEKKTQTQTSGFGGSSNVPDMSGLVGIKTSDITGFVNLVSGQFATTDDQITISKNVAEAYDLKAGDKLTYIDLVQNKELTVTVTGIVENKNFIVSIGSAQTTLNRIQQIPGHLDIYNLTVSRDKVTEAESYLQKNFAGADVTNLSFITNVINKILDNVTAFPLLLGFLCLIAGAVLIANNVALAVLERRTEMGVMKSLGADDGRVLSIINYESSILGLVGGLFGLVYAILLALFAVQAFGTAENPATLAISPWLLLGMLALSLGLAIGATMFSAWGAAREKPMVVLRYE